MVLFPFTIFILFVVFHLPIERILNTAFVIPLLSTVKASWYLDLIFFGVLLYFLIHNYHKAKSRIYFSLNTLGYWLVTLFMCGWYRIQQEPWEFLSLEFIQSIKYLDVLPIIGLVNTALILRSAFLKPLSPQTSLGFIEDNPINEASDDKLNYAMYASKLAAKLNQSSFKNSFAVGVTGEWGTGKTSFVNLVKSNLDDSKFIKIDFNAWDSHSPKAIIKDFFTTLTSNLSKYHSDISTLLLNYSETLIKSYDPVISSILNPISSDLKSKSIIEQRVNIEKAIPKIYKRIVVCIDELDRLDRKELIEVIKLIRSTANFPNVIFIVSYDRNYLIEAIRKLNKQNSESFLEKIFQIEITLPYFGISSLQELMYGKLRNLIEPESHEEIKKVIWDQVFFKPPHYAGHITTIRD
jgi:hypothetical protein